MGHPGSWCGTMPVLGAGRTPHDVAGTNFLDWFAPLLRQADARSDDQVLALGMAMPGGAGARFKGHESAGRIDLGIGGRQRIDPCATGEVLCLRDYRGLGNSPR